MINHTEQRIMAIDYGTKRIGIAISDPLCLFPSITLTINNDHNLITNLLKLIVEKKVNTIVLGFPDYTGQKTSSIAEKILMFKDTIQKRKNIKIELWDENMTSSLASDRIIASVTKKSKRQNKGLIDAHSAAIILEDYLRSNSKKMSN
ncbi:MAG: Holliday junction resolvase RuvX [Ignavibacteriaceae bacterium]|nr:Holliday junction resolvase RuvX [Ignavibacteriaceae bacterium]